MTTRVETIGGHSVTFVGDAPMVAIYCIRPSAGEPAVYVGSTAQQLRLRIRAHLLDARKGSALPVHVWLRAANGFAVEVLERVEASRRREREMFWVASFGDLLNVTDGGPGMSGHRFAGTDHARRIAAKIRTSEKFVCEQCGAGFHRKHSQVVKGNCRFCSKACYQRSQVGRSRKIAA